MKGHLRKRGPNSWQLLVDLPKHEGKGRNRRFITIRATGQRDAQRKANKILGDIGYNKFSDADGKSVARYLSDWLDTKTDIAPSTRKRYAEIVNLQLIPNLGHIELEKLKPMDIRKYYRDTEKIRSSTTVLQYHRVLSQALEMAVNDGLLAINPIRAVKAPSKANVEYTILSEVDMANLLEIAEGNRHYAAILLGGYCGLRRGEALALRWADIDWNQNTLHVRRSLSLVNAREFSFKSPKSISGKRPVIMSQFVVDGLRHYRATQLEQRLLLGPSWKDNDLICPDRDGTPWSPENFTKSVAWFFEKNGFTKLNFHGLRHSHAAHLVRANIHPRAAAGRFGHSNPTMFLNTYAHCLPGLDEEAARKIEESYQNACRRK